MPVWPIGHRGRWEGNGGTLTTRDRLWFLSYMMNVLFKLQTTPKKY